ncbi:MAG: GNAT family N-acetyltransferase [Patescibacteria group bacterium]|nr:GNAT family N-acetyltransferase [Patescibacteria group bacterium]MDD5715210.1 GNAT family N-acetyltransferase [Patescibacteria group bacterium]
MADSNDNDQELDISLWDIFLGNFKISNKVIKRFFKKLDNFFKFIIFNHWTSRNFYIRYSQNLDDMYRIYRLRYEVYCEQYNYLQASNYPHKLESDEYDPYSEHFVLLKRNFKGGVEEIVGYVRLILISDKGFPIENHFKINSQDKIDRNHIAEISRLILSPDYRRFHLMLLLIRAMYHYVKSKGITQIYSVMDDRLLNMLLKLSFPFNRIGEYSSYQGHTCPNLLKVAEMEDFLKRKNPLFYNFFSKK